MGKVVNQAIKFTNKYGLTLAFRVKKHAAVVERHLNDDEKVLYVFAGRKTDDSDKKPKSAVIAITNKRILIGRCNLFNLGYSLNSITPDLYNDLKITSGVIFGAVIIDTIKETIVVSSIDKHALPEVENNISKTMIELKKEYIKEEKEKEKEKDK